MTYADLKRIILNRGFELDASYKEEPTIMTDAINTAMRQITNEAPIIGKYKIAQNPIKNLLSNAGQNMDIKHYDGTNSLTYNTDGGKSLYFECSGNGDLTITDNDGERVIPLQSSKAYREYREFVNGRVSLSFGGEFSYDIKNIAVYGEKYSDLLEDIPPYRQYIRYDFKELTAIDGVPVFIDFLDKVLEGDYSSGNSYMEIKDFQVEGKSVIVLNGFEKAEYTVFYKRDFIHFTPDTPLDFIIELDFEIEEALPLLAAWYTFREDEESKAVDWLNQANEMLLKYAQRIKASTAESTFINELGW